jgi:hypothetical protein
MSWFNLCALRDSVVSFINDRSPERDIESTKVVQRTEIGHYHFANHYFGHR